ncbi:MAG: bifunctional phosphopantothenoylcysteine decarboxylase/phosphopantothenate--cysteine ligase CoaBC [Methanolinea sp.]|nr:bifunctional phosphopantothenoylcysteine decarboxylase/phosphopantothenate--cysteine ligase CoaBC [Methanolinea sp.]
MRVLPTLEGRTIVLAVTGSIAAVETVRLAHALRRREAQVQAVMSPAACRILHPDALTYATGRPAITAISGLVEHIAFCGDEGAADLLVVAPCTANTLCKIAHGIDDTPVTTFATTAIGRGMPVMVVPAMHHSMFRHPGVAGCLEILESWGIGIVSPRIEEGKAKIADIEEIVLRCERKLLGKPLEGRHILITSGPCREAVDDVRILTTRSSGRMGEALARHAFRLGARVTLVHQGSAPYAENVQVAGAEEMRKAVHAILSRGDVDLYLSAAAISDFSPEPYSGKIPSGTAITLSLRPLPKLIDEVVKEHHVPVVAFKMGYDEEARARKMLDSGIGLVVVNRPEVMGSEDSRVTLLGASGFRKEIGGTKDEVAREILDAALPLLLPG